MLWHNGTTGLCDEITIKSIFNTGKFNIRAASSVVRFTTIRRMNIQTHSLHSPKNSESKTKAGAIMASVAQHAVVIVHSHFHDNLLRNKNFVELMASIYGIFGCEKRHSEFDRFGLIFIFHFGHSVAVIFLFSVFFLWSMGMCCNQTHVCNFCFQLKHSASKRTWHEYDVWINLVRCCCFCIVGFLFVTFFICKSRGSLPLLRRFVFSTSLQSDLCFFSNMLPTIVRFHLFRRFAVVSRLVSYIFRIDDSIQTFCSCNVIYGRTKSSFRRLQ